MHEVNGFGEGRITWVAKLDIDKYSPETVAALNDKLDRSQELKPQFDALEAEHETLTITPANILTNTALGRIANMITGTTAAPWTSSYVRMGVGNGTTAATAADVDLSGAVTTGRYWVILDPSYPTVSGAIITYRATYADTVANFTWNEWGLDLVTAGSPGSVSATGAAQLLLNHKVTALGTKAMGAIWIATATLTLTSS